jgi:hypothetical protein
MKACVGRWRVRHVYARRDFVLDSEEGTRYELHGANSSSAALVMHLASPNAQGKTYRVSCLVAYPQS